MATTTARKAAAAKPARTSASRTRKPAAKANGTPAAEPKATDRAAKAKATNEAAVASGESQTCEGPCAKALPITKFPTTTRNKDGVMGRGTTCRACRDARRAQKKAA